MSPNVPKKTEYRKEGTGLVYIDLPGVGNTTTTYAFSTRNDQESYCKRFRLQAIDYFLLVSQNKFNNQEKLLADYITQILKKNFLFVQTKMDLLREEFGNQAMEDKEGFDAVKTMIRTDIQKELGRNSAERIFLVSNRVIKVGAYRQQRRIYDISRDYEFDLLLKQIQDDMLGEDGLNSVKGQAFILATDAISESAIRAKANVLRNQSWGWATLSGLIGAVPIPGVSISCDAAIIVAQATNYFNAFGLNPIRYFGEGSATKKIKKLTQMMSASIVSRNAIIVGMAFGFNVVEEEIKLIPIVGSVVGAGISFISTCALLRQLIDFCESEALKVIHQN
jgi:uncharacterized protein (DUF697 family)